jgi:hypothetical protein
MNCRMFSTGLSSGDLGGAGHQGDVVGDGERLGEVPAGLVEHKHGVGTGVTVREISARCSADCGGVAARQDQTGRAHLGRAEGAEDVGRAGPPIARCRGARATPGPAPGDLVFSDCQEFRAEVGA